MNIILILIAVLSDIFFWGYLHEKKGFNFFWETLYNGKPAYPLYRILQFAISIICLYILYPDYLGMLGFLGAHYFLVTDFLYYWIKGDLSNMKWYEGEDTYWLSHGFQFGYFIFVEGFNWEWFKASTAIGITLTIASNLKLII